MRWEVVLVVGAACLLSQVSTHIPSRDKLCETSVDSIVEEGCLECFQKAGSVSQHPDEVRRCVGVFLPPMLANCSVPHAERSDNPRIQVNPGNVHHNHSNANLLPNCLSRGLRRLNEYLKREIEYVLRAEEVMDYMLLRKWVRHGGPTMISIHALIAILEAKETKALLNTHAYECLNKYDYDGMVKKSTLRMEEEFGPSLLEIDSDEMELDDDDDDDEIDLDDDYDDDIKEERVQELLRNNHPGNNIPFGGTNIFSEFALLSDCIIKSVIDNGAGHNLLIALNGSFLTIPEWWVKPLLQEAKITQGV